MRARRISFAVALALSAAAFAWPVDVRVDLDVGKEKFHKLDRVDWVESADPKIATAELLDGGELLMTGKSPGRTLLLLYAGGKFAVWQLRVAPKDGHVKPDPREPAEPAVSKVCGKVDFDNNPLEVTVRDEACRKAMLDLLKTDGWLASEVEITFELEALQAQLADVQGAIDAAVGKGKVSASYLGAGLSLAGSVSEAEHRRVLWAVFFHSVGRAPVDDQLQLQVPHPDPLPKGEGRASP